MLFAAELLEVAPDPQRLLAEEESSSPGLMRGVLFARRRLSHAVMRAGKPQSKRMGAAICRAPNARNQTIAANPIATSGR